MSSGKVALLQPFQEFMTKGCLFDVFHDHGWYGIAKNSWTGFGMRFDQKKLGWNTYGSIYVWLQESALFFLDVFHVYWSIVIQHVAPTGTYPWTNNGTSDHEIISAAVSNDLVGLSGFESRISSQTWTCMVYLAIYIHLDTFGQFVW